MNRVYILGGLRSFICVEKKAYKNIPVERLASEVLKAVREKYLGGLYPDSVILGNSVGGGGNIARLSSLYADFPDSVTAFTVDAQCASGLEAIRSAYAHIAAGLNDCIIAGGAESLSTEPTRYYNRNHPLYSEEKPFYKSAQFIPNEVGDDVMIRGADLTAKKHGVTRDMLNEYITESHRNAAKAAEKGVLSGITTEIFGLGHDQSIRPDISERLLNKAKPILEGGITTPASSCLKHDGSAFVVLCSEKFLKENSLSADFKIVTAAAAGSDGMLSPEGILTVIPEIIKKSGIPLSKIDRIDYNEAFAVVDYLYRKNYEIPSNAFGGALAYGHPYGASGAIIALHLMKAMELYGDSFGICAVPAAGGISEAIMIERLI